LYDLDRAFVASHVFGAIAEILLLHNSGQANTLATQVVAEGLSHDEIKYLRGRLQVNESYARVDAILAKLTTADNKHLQDYINLAEDLILTEAEIATLDKGEVKDAFTDPMGEYGQFQHRGQCFLSTRADVIAFCKASDIQALIVPETGSDPAPFY